MRTERQGSGRIVKAMAQTNSLELLGSLIQQPRFFGAIKSQARGHYTAAPAQMSAQGDILQNRHVRE